MRAVVVDTSVVSYLLKEHTLAPRYWDLLRGNLLGISFMSVAELYRWPLERQWGAAKIVQLKSHLRSYTVLASDDAMCWTWGRLMSAKGRPISAADAWIAASALRYSAPLVTHNAQHFSRIEGLEVLTVQS